MATATYTPNRFGSSVSGAQAFGATQPSMADTLPTIDFNFNDLRERMSQFTARFDEFIERGRKRVLEERNEFRMNLADMEDQRRQRQQSISQFENKSNNHAHVLAKEAQETDEMDEAIRSLTTQKDELVARRDQARAEIATTQATIKQRREAQTAHQRALDAQAQHNVPELRFWEDCLGMRIEGTGVEDQLRFVFVNAHSKDNAWDSWFDLNMGGRTYEIVGTKPRLENDDIDAAQERLNETKDLAAFLKTMRNAFREVLK